MPMMVTETATRKRVFSMQQSEKSSIWNNRPFAPFNPYKPTKVSEVTPPSEKRLRTLQKPESTFKWEPELPDNLHFSAGNGFRDIAVKTPLPANWQSFSLQGASLGLSPSPAVKQSGREYERLKEEMRGRNGWFAKLDYSTGLAEDALDKVGRPAIGLKLSVGPTESYYQKFQNAQRELEDYKRVVQAVNCLVPFSADGLTTIKRRGSNLQQGPRNLYNFQADVRGVSQDGGSWGHLYNGMQNGDFLPRPLYCQPQPDNVIAPDLSVEPRATLGTSNCRGEHTKEQMQKDEDYSDTWLTLYKRTQDPALRAKMVSRQKDIDALTEEWSRLALHREEDKARREQERQASKKEEISEAFIPLSSEVEEAVEDALHYGSRSQLLVLHEETNIEVTRAIIQCLLPGQWLNDEVINVYMQLMKEREIRESQKFLKCHFFNTFFYNKLYKDKRSYDYKSVRRWTTQKKLVTALQTVTSNGQQRKVVPIASTQFIQILVPIHQDIHWCLAVINLRDQRFEYLDSLKGRDDNVLQVLARYIVDEAKDKSNRVLDVSKWERSFPQDIPEQLNGCDCGMFMVKYADFHSRGAPLSFTQAHMEYFRRRTVYEILKLEAT